MDSVERVDFHGDFEEALAFACNLHSKQTRKGTDIPYISHLIGVAGLVLEHGGNRDEAIAALLHDSIEDQGHDFTGGVQALRKAIGQMFGERVLQIVDDCTDSDTAPANKPEWRQRKESYLRHLETVSAATRVVSCADKLHNARAIVSDLRVMGDTLFDRFNGRKDGTLWYYRELASVFNRLGPARLAEELQAAVNEMDALAGRGEH
jgi:(p)ppGpp synthase/HD superfamily hydrolase